MATIQKNGPASRPFRLTTGKGAVRKVKFFATRAKAEQYLRLHNMELKIRPESQEPLNQAEWRAVAKARENAVDLEAAVVAAIEAKKAIGATFAEVRAMREDDLVLGKDMGICAGISSLSVCLE